MQAWIGGEAAFAEKKLTAEALKAKRLARNEDIIELVGKDSMDMN